MRIDLGSSLTAHMKGEKRKSLARGRRNATVIAVAAQKGGVGKTTTSVTLGSAWARYHDKRVLIIDLDPQSHVNLALRDQVFSGGGSLASVLADHRSHEVEEITTATDITGLYVTPADPALTDAQIQLASKIGKEMILRKALEVTRSHYDLIVIDCPPDVGTFTVNALTAADYVLVPAQLSALSVSGVSGLLGAVAEVQDHLNPALQVLGVALTRVDGRNKKSNEAVTHVLSEAFGDLLLPVSIGVNDALSQAQMAGLDIFTYDPMSRGATHYRALADHLVRRMEALAHSEDSGQARVAG